MGLSKATTNTYSSAMPLLAKLRICERHSPNCSKIKLSMFSSFEFSYSPSSPCEKRQLAVASRMSMVNTLNGGLRIKKIE